MKYIVQYQNAEGEWIDITAPFAAYEEALKRLNTERGYDPHFSHRVIVIREEVLAFISGTDNGSEGLI